jgi:hypothetical protein
MTQPESKVSNAFRRATEEPDGTVSFESVARRARRHHRVAAATSTTVAVVAVVALAGVGSQMFRSVDGHDSPLRGVTSTSVAPAASGSDVSGQLRLTGGPSSASEHGTSGTVYFVASDGTKTTVSAAVDGAFSVRLKPGVYTVTGASPLYGDGKYVCQADNPVTVSADRRADVLVACDRI